MNTVDLEEALNTLLQHAIEKKRVKVYKSKTGIIYVPKELADKLVDRYIVKVGNKLVVIIVSE